jgi:Transposase DDE domain
VGLTAANVHDSTMLEPVLDAVPPVRQCAGRPRKRPAKLHGDKAYDYPRCRRACRKRRIVPRLARRRGVRLPGFGDQHVAVGLEQQVLGHAAEKDVGDTGAAVRARHQQIGRKLARQVEEDLAR